MLTMSVFERCLKVVIRNEGGFQAHPSDRGNYRYNENTGEWDLVGTKYGIAARFFPHVDIANLSLY